MRRPKRLNALGGRLVIEPDLPPLHFCGGYESPYMPELTLEQLRSALSIPELSIAALESVRAELDRRGALSEEPRPHLCSVEVERHPKERAERAVGKLIDRLRKR